MFTTLYESFCKQLDMKPNAIPNNTSKPVIQCVRNVTVHLGYGT
jgi:hypothetical protein